MRLAYQEALTDNACSNLLELQKEAGLLSWKSHRVIKLAIGSPSATSGDIQMGEELTHVDDIEVSNLPMESIDVLLSDSPDSKVHLHLISLGGVGKDVFLNRIAWDKPSISWSRAVYPLRMRRQKLEKSILPPDGQVAPAR